MIKYTFTILIILSVCACTTSPTGRKQFTLFGDNEIDAMGIKSFQQIKKKTPIEKNKAINQYVGCINQAIIRELPEQYRKQNWEAVVFQDETLNAFALPGAKIGVHTGMVRFAENADQLAAVIGHEVGHVIARHGNERLSQQFAASQALGILSGNTAKERGIGMAVLGLGAQVGILLPFSRLHESEADRIGIDLMAKAGFNPRGSVKLWQNMRKKGGKSNLELLSTHPANNTRIKQLNERLAQANQSYNQALQAGKKPNCIKPKLPEPKKAKG